MHFHRSPWGIALASVAVALTSTLLAQDPEHRWSFNNMSLANTGTAGGPDALIVDPDGDPNVGGGSTLGANDVTLAGGASNTSDYVNLGSNLLSPVTGNVTIELWATPVAVQNWGRIFDFGNRVGDNGEDYLFMSWSIGTNGNADRVEWREVTPDIGGSTFLDNTNSPYVLGTEYHITMNICPGAGTGGTTLVTWNTAPSGDSDLGAMNGSFSTANTLASLNDVNGWLGRSQWAGDNTANATYNEMRIFYRKVTAPELESYHDLGPDNLVHPDGDNDGLPAWWEGVHGFDDGDDGSTNAENGPGGNPDGDSADNAAEYAAGTDPNDPLSNPNDTDADGLDDAWELDNFGDLLQDGTGDPDQDGSRNEAEETDGTNPNDPNSWGDGDGDGIPDDYESQVWGNTTTATATSDGDGDTYSDLEEYQARTDPDNIDFSPVKAQMIHRWSFNGDLLDAVGGSNAQILDANNDPATGGGSDLDTTNSGEVRLFGGGQGDSDYVLLGNNLLGGKTTDVTIEIWGTAHGTANWSRVFSMGSGTGNVASVLMQAWTRGTNIAQSRIEWRSPGHQTILDTNQSPAVYPLGVEHHILIHFDNDTQGGTRVTLYKNPSGDPDLGPVVGTAFDTHTLADLVDDVNWLGRSQFGGDPTANASYNEVRIYDGLVHPKVAEQLHDQGPNDADIVDSDGDCLPDFWEIANGLDEMDATGDNGAFGDPDGDGVINRDEYAQCTDPSDPDGDGDGLADAWELENFGDLSQDGTGDPDRDGADNESEETAGSDPNDRNSFPDSDSDGLPDPYEVAVWGDLATADANSDQDNDTYLDVEEFQAGTDPENGNFSPNKPEILHRWSFNSNDAAGLMDLVGGSDAQIVDADNDPNTGGGSDLDTTNPGELRLFGGAASNVSDHVLLGNNLVGGTPYDVTIEGWVTQHAANNWSRMWSFGSSTGEVLFQAFTRGTNLATSRVEFRDGPLTALETDQDPAVFPLGVEHHVVVHLDNNNAGGTQMTLYKAPSGDSDLGEVVSTVFAPRTLEDLVDNVNWLGRSQFGGDGAANASYNEFRIYRGLLNPKLLEQLHDQGADDAGIPDSDGDCLPDFWEIANGLDEMDGSGDNGAFGDPDGDGLINRDEYAQCTDPLNADSDGDGFPDPEELSWETDPNDAASSPSSWARSLCGYWRMENDLLDSTPLGHDASGRNGPTFAASPLGNAVVLDKASHQYVVVDSGNTTRDTFNIDGNGVNDSAEPESGDMTISVWLKSAGFSQAWQAVVAKGEGSDYRLARRDQNDDVVYAGGAGTGGDLGTSPAVNVNDGAWHHVVVQTEDGVAKRIWVDGVKGEATGAADLNNNNTGTDGGLIDWLMLGGNPDGNEGDTNNNQYRTFGGCLDDVAFWKRPLSELEVLGLYNQGVLLGRDLQFLIDNADSDGDGVLDDDETGGTFGFVTNPNNPDTDGDGVDDGVELLAGSDPTVDDDPDGDGLLNSEETSGSGNGFDGAPTDPYNSDSDGDGIDDSEEGSAGADGFVTNPNAADTDGDGYPDPMEVAQGSDPTNGALIPFIEMEVYYPFDVLDGSQVCNFGTDWRQGTLAGGSGIVASTNAFGGGAFGDAWQGNRPAANDAFVNTNLAPADLGFGEYTVMAWVKWDGTSGGEDHMVFGANAGDAGGQLHHGIRANNGTTPGENDLHFGHWGNDIGDAGTIVPDVWTHLAWTYDGTTARVWVDGSQTASGNVGGLGDPSLGLAVGFTRHGSFNGCLDEVKIFSRAMIQQEIQAAMAAPAPFPVPGDSLENWRLCNFGTIDNTGDAADMADPNGDDWENIFSFLLGFSPKAPAAPPAVDADVPSAMLFAPGVPRIDVQNVPNGVEFSLIYSRRVDRAGLSVEVEFSADMNQWFPNTGGETILDTVGDFELVRVTFPFFLPDGRKARFWHLVVP